MNTINIEVIALAINACTMGNLYGSNQYKTRPTLFAISVLCTICGAIGLMNK